MQLLMYCNGYYRDPRSGHCLFKYVPFPLRMRARLRVEFAPTWGAANASCSYYGSLNGGRGGQISHTDGF